MILQLTRDRGRPARRRREWVISQRDTCRYCGKPVDKTLSGRDRWGPTEAHLQALCEGGDERDPANLDLAHMICNVIEENKRRALRRAQARQVRSASRRW